MKEKLGAEFRPYMILGACNPQLAHRALTSELDLGLLLPCNIVAYADNSGSVVEVMNPEAALALIENPALAVVAAEATQRLRAALARVES